MDFNIQKTFYIKSIVPTKNSLYFNGKISWNQAIASKQAKAKF